jgi:GNAT superfamily N-acetyltransferase
MQSIEHAGNTTAPWARALSFRASLRDGRPVTIRPITSTDKPRLVAALDAMSPKSRYLRFHGARERLTEGELRYLTELDYDNHVAWGAIAEHEAGRPGIGVARFVRDPNEPDTAEFSIAVVDAWQRTGLGSLLLRTLLVSAADRHVRRLVGSVLQENTAALLMFAKFGGEPTVIEDDAVVVEIPVVSAHRTLHVPGQVLIRRRELTVNQPPGWIP